MTNTSCASRSDGTLKLIPDDQERLPYGSLLPPDFPDRLRRLKEASGLTWSGFAAAVGVDYKQMYRWHKEDVEPSGGAMFALFDFASTIPGGVAILLAREFQLTYLKD